MFHYILPISAVWDERALIPHFRKGLTSRILDQLASHPSRINGYYPGAWYQVPLEANVEGTQSFPYFVHIPSFNSHQSLQSSKDEVFKEIQDVGEDNSVSSLHLFFGNVEFPPSSHHDSLEELWDEEEESEEIETIIKVIPSAYYQYLDVFSKLKAEKLPPHCTSDHHIELEGFLPPVRVIYSLSNQDSVTLRPYISENLEKGSIQPSSSSTGAPVLFVKKKDGGLHLCVDY
ncbi:hypothetical protein O181_030690 [Austropuccinia psidii MF-1]|uniref:Uncharacterized protein n=1 Tax=Austropuccinia psidii MF-1 TaxID=1389203 RepID=A0A9Q3H6G6_9BASI|nr:hypothetical protein [Austropuccinia psidii MF-1]